MDDELYLVVIDECYVRDTRRVENKYFKDVSTIRAQGNPGANPYTYSYKWVDLPGDVVLGTWYARDSEDAMLRCSRELDIPIEGLKSYRLWRNSI